MRIYEEHDAEQAGGEQPLADSLCGVVLGLLTDRDAGRALRRAMPALSHALGDRPCGLYQRSGGWQYRLVAGSDDRLPSDVSAADLPMVGTSVPVDGDDLGALLVGGGPLDATQRLAVDAVAAVLGAVLSRAMGEHALREGQAMEAVGRLTARLADDLSRLIRQVLSDAEGLAPPGAPQRSGVDLIRRHGRQAAAITEQLRTFSEGAQAGVAGTDLRRVVELSTELLDGMLDIGVSIEVRGGDEQHLVVVPRPVTEQIVIRLVALMLAGTMARPLHVVFELTGVELPASRDDAGLRAGRYVRVEVTGTPEVPGLERSAAPGAPERNTSWDVDRCRVALTRLVQPRGGDLLIEPATGDSRSLRAVVHLPCGQANELTRTVTTGSMSMALPVVLLAEDQATVRSLLRGILTQRGYRVLEAEDGLEALRLLGRTGRLDLLATDLVMPHLGGRQLAEHARAVHPDLPVIFFTGYTDLHAVAPPLPRSLMLHKPFGMGDFVRCVDDMVAASETEVRQRVS